MSEVLVFGANGKMGRPICDALTTLNYDVVGVDNCDDSSRNQKHYYSFHTLDVEDYTNLTDFIRKHQSAQAVVSALPYFLNGIVAKTAFEYGIPYFDLGGSVPFTRQTKTLSNTYGVHCFTDLGLAPGWVNIVAEHAYQALAKVDDVYDIQFAVGGLPYSEAVDAYNPPFNYELTWSVDGLLNEYMDDCEILHNGEIITVPGMSGLTNFTKDGIKFEAFYTSGAASHTLKDMQQRDVEHAGYRTIRFQGHRDTIALLLDSMGESATAAVLESTCKNGLKDTVVMLVEGSCKNEPVIFEKIWVVKADDRYTAMQKCTAFPLVAVVDQFISKGLPEHKVLTYKDVDYTRFSNLLSVLLGQDVA